MLLYSYIFMHYKQFKIICLMYSAVLIKMYYYYTQKFDWLKVLQALIILFLIS